MRRNTRGWGQKAESTGSAHLPSGQLGQAAFTLQPHGPRSSTTDTSRRGRVGVAVVCPALRSDIVPKVWTGIKVEGGVVMPWWERGAERQARSVKHPAHPPQILRESHRDPVVQPP